MISDEKLDAMQKICDAASEGPWETAGRGCEVRQMKDLIDCICSMQLSNQPYFREDANFIANARTQMPELITEVRELKKKLLEISPK